MIWNEIISIICMFCSAGICCISLQGQTKLKILFIQLFACLFYLANYLFVININATALIGVITASCEILRLIAFYFIEKSEKYNTFKFNFICAMFFNVLLITLSVIAWSSWFSFLPLVGAILVNLSLSTKNVVLIKFAFVIQAALVITFLILSGLFINAIPQMFICVFGIVGIVKLDKQKQ